MSIEAQLEKLNANLLRLTEAMEDLKGVPAKAPAKKAPAKKAPAKKAPAKKAPAKKARTKKVNYDRDVKPMVLMAISTPEGREEVKDLLATYEVTKAPDLDEADYPEFLKGVEAIVEKYEDE